MGLLKWLIVIRAIEQAASPQASDQWWVMSPIADLVTMFVLVCILIVGLIWAYIKTNKEYI